MTKKTIDDPFSVNVEIPPDLAIALYKKFGLYARIYRTRSAIEYALRAILTELLGGDAPAPAVKPAAPPPAPPSASPWQQAAPLPQPQPLSSATPWQPPPPAPVATNIVWDDSESESESDKDINDLLATMAGKTSVAPPPHPRNFCSNDIQIAANLPKVVDVFHEHSQHFWKPEFKPKLTEGKEDMSLERLKEILERIEGEAYKNIPEGMQKTLYVASIAYSRWWKKTFVSPV